MARTSVQAEWLQKYADACASLIAANDNVHAELTRLCQSYEEARDEAAQRWAAVHSLIDEFPD